jgi:cysteine synthase
MLYTSSPKPVNTVLDAIGSTPLVKLSKVNTAGGADVYVKLDITTPPAPIKTAWPWQ